MKLRKALMHVTAQCPQVTRGSSIIDFVTNSLGTIVAAVMHRVSQGLLELHHRQSLTGKYVAMGVQAKRVGEKTLNQLDHDSFRLVL